MNTTHSFRTVFARFGRRWLPAFLLAFAGSAAGEVRGTWLTTTGVDHIRSGRETAETLSTLRGAGLNTAYIEAWKAGYTQYPSQALFDLIGRDRTPTLGNRDLLDEAVIQAHRNNMAAVAWFEYGFAVQFVGAGNPVSGAFAREAESRGWLLEDGSGQYANSRDGFAWMNPAVPEVRQFLVDIVVEAVRDHDLDGVQFDDRLAWPRSLGYDATTNALINQRFNVDITTSHPTYNDRLNTLRTEALDAFVDELHAAVRAVDPDVWISLAPSVNGFSQQNYTADWPDWLQQGHFDEVVPQVYRPSIGSFNASLPSNVSPFTATNREDDAIMGLRFNGSGSDTPLNDLLAMIESTRSAANGALAGHSIWYSDNAVDFADELADFYAATGDAWVPNPNLQPGRRPDPLVGVEFFDGWDFEISDEGLYRLVSQYDNFDRWRTEGLIYLRPGVYTFELSFAPNQLELLADRRPLPGDANGNDLYDANDADQLAADIFSGNPDADLNGDGSVNLLDLDEFLFFADTSVGDLDLDGDVDLADAAALVARYGTSSIGGLGMWSAGDLNADGLVDFTDAVLLRRNYNGDAGALDAAFAAVPEPALAALLLPAVIFPRRRNHR